MRRFYFFSFVLFSASYLGPGHGGNSLIRETQMFLHDHVHQLFLGDTEMFPSQSRCDVELRNTSSLPDQLRVLNIRGVGRPQPLTLSAQIVVHTTDQDATKAPNKRRLNIWQKFLPEEDDS